MVSFIIIITLCAAASCTKHQHSLSAAHSLRHRSSDRGHHTPKTGRSSSSANSYNNPSPLDIYPEPNEKDGMMLVILANPGKRAGKIYPYEVPSISDKYNDVSHDKFEQYASSNPREMDALIDAYGYSSSPFSVASSRLPGQTKDGASNPIHSAYSEENNKIYTFPEMNKQNPSGLSNYLQNLDQDSVRSPYSHYQDIPIDMSYLPFEEPSPTNTSQMVPQWSLFPEKVEYVIRVLKKNMEMTSSSNTNLRFAVMQQYPPWIHYTLLITLCLEMINDVVTKGEDAYELDFDQTIIETVNTVSANPQEAAQKIKQKLDKTYESVAPILRYINNVIQSEICFNAVECDTIIEHALIQTSNLQLKLQAILLQATINLADIFMNQHAEVFELASKEHRAFEYVFSVDSRDLAPLVAAGYTVRMIRKYLSPTDTSAPFNW